MVISKIENTAWIFPSQPPSRSNTNNDNDNINISSTNKQSVDSQSSYKQNKRVTRIQFDDK